MSTNDPSQPTPPTTPPTAWQPPHMPAPPGSRRRRDERREQSEPVDQYHAVLRVDRGRRHGTRLLHALRRDA